MEEPVLSVDQIQANVAPGFRLPAQCVVALEADVAAMRRVVTALLGRVTTMRTALAYHRRRIVVAKASRTFGRESFSLMENGEPLRWLNLALGAPILAGAGLDAASAADRSFALGLAARSLALGDPKRSGEPGHKDSWLVGAPGRPVAALLVLGSDRMVDLVEFAEEVGTICRQEGAGVIHRDFGQRLDDDVEHFGFRDGVSQPGIRGRASGDQDDFVTRRRLPPPAREDEPELSAPGEVLVWPGEFVFGYPRQDPNDFRRPLPEAAIDPFLADGSFLVFRRLRQEVHEFRQATRALSEGLRAFPEFADTDEDWLRARLVGRWPSGAPLVRFPEADPGGPVGSLEAYNHFAFRGALPALVTGDGEPVPAAPADAAGLACPMHAHIRKVNPRDAGTNQGPATHTQTLRLLRRGIPYGPPAADGLEPDGVDRGLLFISYQRSIREQFEKLAQDWMNSDLNPEDDRGHDVLVGQAGRGTTGRRCSFARSSEAPRRQLSTASEWIVPTGGAYMFCPSVRALASFAGASGEA